MNLRDALERNSPDPKTLGAAIADEPKLVGDLVALFLTDGHRISHRASNVFMFLAQKRPETLAPHLKRLVRELERDDSTVSIRRNVVRLFQEIDVPKNLAGAVFSRCLEFGADPNEAIATRAFAITAAARIAGKHDELRRELKLLIENQLPHETSPAFKNRAKKILNDEIW